MTTLVYNSFWDDLAHAAFDLDTATVKAMLVTSTYTPNKDTHTKRSDVTNEITGTGYTAGGTTVTCTVAKDTGNDRITFTFSNPSWPSASFTARQVVLYISRGGAATADELIACVDNGSDVTATNGTFTFTFTNALTLQN